MYILNQCFEWDPRKASANRCKHGITFTEAASIFLDGYGVEEMDSRHSRAEVRYLRLGLSRKGNILVVCYTLRSGTDGKTKIRLISARKADIEEQAFYFRGY